MHYSEKIDNFTIDIIEYFDFAWFFSKKYPACSPKNFNIAIVGRQHLYDFFLNLNLPPAHLKGLLCILNVGFF